MAKALEELNKALGPAGDKPARKLRRLKWSERCQIYWHYVASYTAAYRARIVDIRADWFTGSVNSLARVASATS
jgi:hypothetical protein